MQSYFRFFDGWTYRLSNIFSCKQVWVEAWFKIWLNLRSILRSILRSNLWWILGSNWWSSLRISPWSNLIWKAIEMRGALLTVTWGLQLGHCGFFIKSHEASMNSLISCTLYFEIDSTSKKLEGFPRLGFYHSFEHIAKVSLAALVSFFWSSHSFILSIFYLCRYIRHLRVCEGVSWERSERFSPVSSTLAGFVWEGYEPPGNFPHYDSRKQLLRLLWQPSSRGHRASIPQIFPHERV